jgi:hypothetical protein
MNRLAGAILIQAIKDLKKGELQEDVLDFVNSEWFEDLASVVNMNAHLMRSQIKDNSFNDISLRAAYR